MGKEARRDSSRGSGGGGGRDDSFSTPSSFPSPASSSSSDFEFRVSLSPTSGRSSSQLCPADELFYKGQLLPLHLSPRFSMVRTLLLASSSTSSDSTATTASRDSNGSSSSSSFSTSDFHILPDCDSSRTSSVTEEEARRVSSAPNRRAIGSGAKYFSSFATRLSSVFLHRGSKKDPSGEISIQMRSSTTASTKRTNPPTSSSAKELIKKYMKKVKPLYGKLSSLQQRHSQQPQQQQKKAFSFSIRKEREVSSSFILPRAGYGKREDDRNLTAAGSYMDIYSHPYSGNLRYPRRNRCAGSCPSSMRSSPRHSGLLRVGGGFPEPVSSSSSIEELQSAIQGAIAHCKSSMVVANQKKASLPISDQNCGSEFRKREAS